MKVDDIRVFVPSRNFDESKAFYSELGFAKEHINDELVLFTSGECSFFLQRYYHEEFAKNLMLQLTVLDIEDTFKLVSNLDGFEIRHSQLRVEPWGRVFNLWGPSGELWNITEFD